MRFDIPAIIVTVTFLVTLVGIDQAIKYPKAKQVEAEAEYKYAIQAVNVCLAKGGIPVVSEMYKSQRDSTWYICLDPSAVIDTDFGP